MKRRLWIIATCGVLGLGGIALSGCVTMIGTGKAYAERGNHELALPYLLGAWRLDPEDPELNALLRRSLRANQAQLSARSDRMREAGNLGPALGAAKRQEIWTHVAGELDITGFSSAEVAQQVAQLERELAEASLRAVDEASASGASQEANLIALRTALGLRPHDGELQQRYDKLRRRLVRRVGVRLDCAHGMIGLCRQGAAQVLEGITRARRELVEVVWDEEGADMELLVHMEGSSSDSGWRQEGGGQMEAAVQVYNQYKEPKLNKKGKKVTRTVRASWVIKQRWTEAQAHLRIALRDLRNNGQERFSESSSKKAASKARFYEWRGDHRALETLLGAAIRSAGTDQSPPTASETLLQQTVDAAFGAVLPGLIAVMEAPL